MIVFRNIGSSLLLNFLLLALMAMTVNKASSPIKISSAPVEFTWIDVKAKAPKGKTIKEKPEKIPEPVAKKKVLPAPPATKGPVGKKPVPVAQKEIKPQQTPMEPTKEKKRAQEIIEPAPSLISGKSTSITEPTDTKTYFNRDKLSDPPGFISRPLPRYPRLARRAGREGEVLLEILLEADGSITKIEVVKSAGWGFDEAALKAAQSSKFRPGKIGGRPVRSKVRAPYVFRLKGTSKD